MRGKQASLITAVGAAVLIGGSFLHWFHRFDFWKEWESTNFKILVVICTVLALVCSLVCLLAPRARQARYLMRVGGCAALIGAGAAAAVDLSIRQFIHHDFGVPTPKPAIGYWVTLAGAAVMALGGVLALLGEGSLAVDRARAGAAGAGGGMAAAGGPTQWPEAPVAPVHHPAEVPPQPAPV